MDIFKTTIENNLQTFLLYDDLHSDIIELPTKYANSLARKTKFSLKSVEAFLTDIKYFCQALKADPAYGKYPVNDALTVVGSRFIEDYLLDLSKEGLNQNTIHRRDASLKGFFDWLTTAEAGRVRDAKDNPYSDGKLKSRTSHKKIPRYITYIEVTEFIKHGFLNESERCMIHFMFDTGIRISELPRFLKTDLPELKLYPEDQLYFPLLVKGSKGRGRQFKERYTMISRPLIQRINRLHNNWETYLDKEQEYEPMPLFLNLQGNPIQPSAFQKAFQRASKKLMETGVIINSIGPHRLRHGTAYSILKSDHGEEFLQNLVITQKALGHSSFKTTEQSYATMPAPVIAKMKGEAENEEIKSRVEESQYIYDNSFKPFRDHKNKRGHRT